MKKKFALLEAFENDIDWVLHEMKCCENKNEPIKCGKQCNRDENEPTKCEVKHDEDKHELTISEEKFCQDKNANHETENECNDQSVILGSENETDDQSVVFERFDCLWTWETSNKDKRDKNENDSDENKNEHCVNKKEHGEYSNEHFTREQELDENKNDQYVSENEHDEAYNEHEMKEDVHDVDNDPDYTPDEVNEGVDELTRKHKERKGIDFEQVPYDSGYQEWEISDKDKRDKNEKDSDENKNEHCVNENEHGEYSNKHFTREQELNEEKNDQYVSENEQYEDNNQHELNEDEHDVDNDPDYTPDEVTEDELNDINRTENEGDEDDENLGDFVDFVSNVPTRKPKKRKGIDYEQVLFDSAYPKVFVKKCTSGKRAYDTVHSCMYCYNLYTHIQDHLEHAHASEANVEEMLKIKAQLKLHSKDGQNVSIKKTLKHLQDAARYSGDHSHNQAVVYNHEGELLIMRKGCTGTFNLNEYGPCPRCFIWLKLDSSVTMHQKNCIKASTNSVETKGLLTIQSRQLVGERILVSRKLQNVFAIMRNDEVAKVAQSDQLITSLGDIWLMKSIDNKITRKRTSSFRMRLAARFLIEARKQLSKPDLNMCDMISPKHFDVAAETALRLCQKGDNVQDEDLKHPSVALKVGYDLSRVAGIKLGQSLKNGNEVGKSEAQDFLQLIKLQWSVKVGKLAQVTVQERHFDANRKLPHPKDIETVATELSARIKQLDLTTNNQYSDVVKLVLPRLMVYNRRRSGEIEALPIKRYHNRTTKLDDVEQALLGELTVLEKHLVDSQELIWIRGKRGKRVPVLIPLDVAEPLKYLADPDVRKEGGVKAESPFLFANSGNGVFSALECLRNVLQECNAELIHPDRLTSTGYRAYMATIAQCIGLKTHQIQWLCDHLGHTEEVHKTHYRHMLGGIERIQLGKLLLLQDRNLLSQYEGKSLEDIQFSDIVTNIDGGAMQDGAPSAPNTQSIEDPDYVGDPIDYVGDVLIDIGEELDEPKQRKQATRSRWTNKELEELYDYARRWIALMKTPTRKDCLHFMQRSKQNGGELYKRTPALIVKKISAINVKARKAKKSPC